jgi:hypothetical protein
MKLKGRHVYTIEVIEAEWQAVLNSLTKHDWLWLTDAGNGAQAQKGTTSGWWWPAGRKLVFDQIAAPSSEFMDDSQSITLYNTQQLRSFTIHTENLYSLNPQHSYSLCSIVDPNSSLTNSMELRTAREAPSC